MKNKDITKRYRFRFVINIIIAAFIVCVLESLLILNTGRLQSFLGLGGNAHDQSFSAEAVLAYLIIGVLLFTLIFYLLQKKSLDYLARLTEGVHDIAEGDLETKIPVTGDDEFSDMAEQLNSLQEELKTLLKKEREAEQSKTDLITNIAHDLRTPLTSIIGYLDLLSGPAGERLSPEQRSKYLKIACTKSARLEQLISDLFDFTKLSYGRITMKVGYVNIVELLGQLLEEAWPAFREKGLSYEFKSNVDALEISGDGALLARLFDNLIGNAIKYGADGKKVVVRLRADEENDLVEVKVINFGFLISEEDLPLIFNKFYRADRARSSETGGTGLGLAIAKDIAEMHGGSISAASDLNGTVFTVRLKIHFHKEREHFKRA